MSGKPCELADILKFPWIVPEKGNAILIELRKLFMRAGVEPPVASVSSNSVHTLKATVASSEFLTMLPAMAFHWEKKNGILQTIDLRGGSSFRHLCVLRRAARPLLPAANLVLSEIRKFAKSTDAGFKPSSNSEEQALVRDQSHAP
jgi:LysR family transcriptional regulator of gallate degradation